MPVEVPALQRCDIEQVRCGLRDRPPREGEDAFHDTMLVGQRVTQAHQQGSNSAVVARARGAERRVDVGVQEQLRDSETAGGLTGSGYPSRLQVNDREARVVREVSTGGDEVLKHPPYARLTCALTQGSDRSLANTGMLRAVTSDRQERSRRGGLAHEAQRLDQPCPARGIRRACRDRQHRLEGDCQHIARGHRPLLERVLRQHPREPTAPDQGDQARDRREPWQPLAERPRRVFVDEGSGVVQKRDQTRRGLFVEHL